MVTVFPGWYIKVARKSFLSKTWRLILHDGVSTSLGFENGNKDNVDRLAQKLLEDICKDRLELCKRDQPEAFKQILADSNTMWDTQGPMGRIPLGMITKKLYPNGLE
jgi:hypothetical protein